MAAVASGDGRQVEVASSATPDASTAGSGIVCPSGITLSAITFPLLFTRGDGMVNCAPFRLKLLPVHGPPVDPALPSVMSPALASACCDRLLPVAVLVRSKLDDIAPVPPS